MAGSAHVVVIETTFPDGEVVCEIQRFRVLPISDMDSALATVHSWEDGVCGATFRGEDEHGAPLSHIGEA